MGNESRTSVVCYLQRATLVFLLRDDRVTLNLTGGYPPTWAHNRMDCPPSRGLLKYLLPEEWVT